MSITRAMFLVLATLLAGCGGGGGSTAPVAPANVLSGAYQIVTYTLRSVPAPGASSSFWGQAVVNPNGQLDVTGEQNAPAAGGIGPALPGAYAIVGQGSGHYDLEVTGTPVYRGGVSDDGAVAIFASVASGLDPSLLILMRGDAATGPSFSGTYDFANMSVFGAEYGTHVFNGAGGMSVDSFAGGGGGPIGMNAFSYSLGSMNLTTMWSNTSAAVQMQGGTTADRALAAWAGGTNAAAPSVPFGWAAVRRSSGLTNAAIRGTYHVVAMEQIGGGVATTTGLMTADGAGTFSITGDVNANGAINPNQTVTGTYNLSGTGNLVLNRSNLSEGLTGTVSQDGRYILLGGGSTAGSSQMFILMVRQ